MNNNKQVSKLHYSFSSYYTKSRWCSIWHQINEVLRFEPKSVLEVGGGLGLFKNAMACFDVPVTIVDIADDLEPDIVASVTDLPLGDKAFDVACAFQVLEHLPFEMFIPALKELGRVARKAIIISLPDAKPVYSSQLVVPFFGRKQLWLNRPFPGHRPLPVGGQHFWEINRVGYDKNKILRLIKDSGYVVQSQFRVPENPYHCFFTLVMKTI